MTVQDRWSLKNKIDRCRLDYEKVPPCDLEYFTAYPAAAKLQELPTQIGVCESLLVGLYLTKALAHLELAQLNEAADSINTAAAISNSPPAKNALAAMKEALNKARSQRKSVKSVTTAEPKSARLRQVDLSL